jgi:hypothetical protein
MFLQNFAQSTADCTVNGQAVDCGEAAQAAGGILAGVGIFMVVIIVFGIINFVIWVLSLIHLIQNEDVDNRILWIVLVLLVPIANFVYYFGFRKHKKPGFQDSASTTGGATPGANPGVVAPQQDTTPGNNNVSMGAVAGGAAASSGFSDQSSAPQPDLSVAANNSDQGATDISIGDDSESTNSAEVAQDSSAPEYSGVDSSPETTESVTPDTDSYQSGSTDEPKSSSDDFSSQQPNSDSIAAGESSSPETETPATDEESGPSVG